MNHDQTRALLIRASAIDNRVVSRPAVDAWADLLIDVDPNEAAEALREHFRTSTDYLLPGHIVAGARRIRDRRDRYDEGREHRALAPVEHVVGKPADFDEIAAQAQKRVDRTAKDAVKNTTELLGKMRVRPNERADAADRRRQARAELDARRTQGAEQ